VLRAVAGIGPDAASAVPDLIAMIVDEQAEDPYNAAATTLEAFGPAVLPFVPQLVELVRQPARARGHPAVLRLLTGLIPHGANLSDLFRDVLRRATAGGQYEGEPTLRIEVVRAAIRGLAAVEQGAESALPELALAYQTFAGPPAGDAREDVLGAYGALGGESVQDIRAALADPSWKMRLAAIKALVATGDTSGETVAALRALETDASSKVRARAAAVLKSMEPKKAKRK
jgi:HEAT repeat protein